MSEQEKIIEVCGKKVVVRYVEHLSPCPRCVFYGEGCTCSEHCLKFDKGNGTGPYFVEAEQPQEPDYKKLYEGIVNSEWYKKNYHGKSVGDSVEIEQPEADLESEVNAYISTWEFDEDAGLFVDTAAGKILIDLDNVRELARHFAEWGAEHLKK